MRLYEIAGEQGIYLMRNIETPGLFLSLPSLRYRTSCILAHSLLFPLVSWMVSGGFPQCMVRWSVPDAVPLKP